MTPPRRATYLLLAVLSLILIYSSYIVPAQDAKANQHESNCGYVDNILPDPSCTPGAADSGVTSDDIEETICVQGYTKGVRPKVSITNAIKKEVMPAYGNIVEQSDDELEVDCSERGSKKSVTKNGRTGKCYDLSLCKPNSNNLKCYELDHLISLELGGCLDCEENLWPEPYYPTPGAHEKDQVENYLHKQVCDGEIALDDAQNIIKTDWYACYKMIKSHKPCM